MSGIKDYVKNNLITSYNGGEIINDKFNHPLLFSLRMSQKFNDNLGNLIDSDGTTESGIHSDFDNNKFILDNLSTNSIPSQIDSEIILDEIDAHHELIMGLPVIKNVNYLLKFRKYYWCIVKK